MDGYFMWLLLGSAALLVVAVAVSCFEHLAQSVRPDDAFASAVPRAVSIDVEIDIPAAAATAVDVTRRREALDGAMVRMAQPASAVTVAPAAPAASWEITTPMVGPGSPAGHGEAVEGFAGTAAAAGRQSAPHSLA